MQVDERCSSSSALISPLFPFRSWLWGLSFRMIHQRQFSLRHLRISLKSSRLPVWLSSLSTCFQPSLSILTSFRQALCAAIFWSLISVGLVLAGILRSGGTASILFLSASYLGSFILALCLCLDTAFGVFHKGDVSALDLVDRPLWVGIDDLWFALTSSRMDCSSSYCWSIWSFFPSYLPSQLVRRSNGDSNCSFPALPGFCDHQLREVKELEAFRWVSWSEDEQRTRNDGTTLITKSVVSISQQLGLFSPELFGFQVKWVFESSRTLFSPFEDLPRIF